MYLLLPHAGMGCGYQVQLVEISSSTTTHTGQRQAKTVPRWLTPQGITGGAEGLSIRVGQSESRSS